MDTFKREKKFNKRYTYIPENNELFDKSRAKCEYLKLFMTIVKHFYANKNKTNKGENLSN